MGVAQKCGHRYDDNIFQKIGKGVVVVVLTKDRRTAAGKWSNKIQTTSVTTSHCGKAKTYSSSAITTMENC
jgi:hypothetical protein